MIDINELRQKITTRGLDVVADTDVLEFLDRLEAAEKERDALRAKIEAMEKQEPVARFNWHKGKFEWLQPWDFSRMNMKPLYLAPGAKAQPAPSVPYGWLCAIDEALVVAHLGVADAADSYEDAKRKLNELICWHTDVATDPAVNGGWKLAPIEPTEEMMIAAEQAEDAFQDAEEGVWLGVKSYYRAMLAAAPEAKPAPSVPSVEAAKAMGAKGGPAIEGERLAFEAWMRGHCWSLSSTWNGKYYQGEGETLGKLDLCAMRTRELWAAWRDRAALAAAPKKKP